MVALAAISNATPSLQSSLMRSRLEVAKREEKQAQDEVDQLRSQISEAQAIQRQRQENVRRLSREADPTYTTRLQTRQAGSATAAPGQLPNLTASSGRIVNTSA